MIDWNYCNIVILYKYDFTCNDNRLKNAYSEYLFNVNTFFFAKLRGDLKIIMIICLKIITVSVLTVETIFRSISIICLLTEER